MTEIAFTETKIKQNIDQVEQAIEAAAKRRAFDIALNQFNEKCEDVYNSFSEWLNCLIDLSEQEREKRQRATYKITYDFLAFIEEQLVGDLFDQVIRNCPNFIKMFNFLGSYCHRVESRYQIETHVEEHLKNNPKIQAILKAYLK